MALNMEALYYFGMLVTIYHSIQSNIPEESNLEIAFLNKLIK
jgi:hypothetical protein